MSLLFLTLLGCRSMELNFVALGGGELFLDQARAQVRRYRLERCDDEATEKREWVGRKIDLTDPRPDQVRDHSWCALTIEFPSQPAIFLAGSTQQGTAFEITLETGDLRLETEFGGSGQEQVILLDASKLLNTTDIYAALESDPQGDPDTEALVEWTADSLDSKQISTRLGDALSILSLNEATRRSDWGLSGTLSGTQASQDESAGCQDNEDTGIWEDTDTGFYSDGSSTSSTSSTSGCGSDPEADTPEDDRSGGGCGSGRERDTSEDSEDSENDTASANVDEGGGGDEGGGCGSEDDTASDDDSGGGGCSGSGGDSGVALGLGPRGTLALLVLPFWALRRNRMR